MSERAALDRAEGLHHGYRDEILTVIAEDATHRALAYVATDKRQGLPVSTGMWSMSSPVQRRTGCRRITCDAIRQIPTVVDEDRRRAAKERALYG